MGRNRTIALTVWIAATILTFSGAMWLLVYGGMLPPDGALVWASIAVAPLVMVSAMVGYALWWLALFLLSFFHPEKGEIEDERRLD